LLATARTLLVIHELRTAAGLEERPPEVGAALDWLRGRQGAPGAWTDGCTDDRHRHGYCHHFAAGFFSPGPPETDLGEVWLSSGVPLTGDDEIRFAVSTVALRAMLAWNAGGTDALLHLAVLRRVVGDWARGQPPASLSAAGLLAAVQALLASRQPEDLEAAERGLHLVAGKQRGDGSWADTDAFQALEVLEAADRSGAADAVTRRAFTHAARLLIASQQSDGSWGRAHGPRRALIGWRTLRRLEFPEG
ncbi:MAG TPA: hypothetical protein VK966_06250, partial [Longimicrobiales bacterium]|nr:hypothetical protein [Longimicrobiales bacterium]